MHTNRLTLLMLFLISCLIQPEARSADENPEKASVSIKLAIDSKNRTKLNGKAVARKDLKGKLKAIVQKDKNAESLEISADRAASTRQLSSRLMLRMPRDSRRSL